ncbi:hypothetical protein BN3456_02287 [Clostridium sp. C105KSO13]|nr:hypothetical protein BN3456_02287 [Clostridium sp. C105KSO13]
MKLKNKEKSDTHLTVRELTILALSAALLFVLQVALGFLPNIEITSLLIIIFTLIYRFKTLYIIYTFALLEGLFYGFGIWWLMYLYVWTILFIVTYLLRKNQSVLEWAIISSMFGFAFGFLCAIPYLFIGGAGAMLAWWGAGIPYDIVHGIGNFFVALFLFKPLYSLIGRIYNKVGDYAN